ncbi:hypothetical protein FRB99_007557 [Tulasnella sp. 403]|nr:hypothetical protein FRB99_007557 [Tulasnella sp. 403]
MTVLSQRSWLFQLPHELLLMILLECSPSALLRCRQTCRRMNDIVQLSAELQYKLYLAFYGYVDNPSCRRSYARKFEKLCRTEQRWYRLQEESQLKIPAPLEVESDFDNGIYVHAPGPGDDPELLRVVQLPPNHDGSPLTNHVEWTIRVPGIPLTGFVIDAEQDLLIIPEKCNIHDSYSLHFLTLSTGAPHPMACAPCLRVPGVTTRTAIGNSVPFDPHCSITIRQNLIIFRSLVNRSSDDSPCPIQVIDWHLGVLNLSLNSSHYRSLAFLNDHTFLTIYRAPSSPVWSLILFETNDKYPGIPFIKGVLSMPPLSLEGDLVMKVHTGASGVPSHSQTSKSKCPPPTCPMSTASLLTG